MEGRVAWITGSSRGIGREVALRLAREGATVAVNYHKSEDAARQLARALEELGTTYLMLRGNVANEQDCVSMVDETVSRFGQLDILVNNAGVLKNDLVLSLVAEDVRNVMDTNFLGTFLVTREASRQMLKHHYGRIVNVSSVAVVHPYRGQSNYVASKGAIEAFTRACAVELSRKGITVNAVAPGAIRTEMLATALALAEKQIVDKTLVRRLGEPADVAAAVAFLASEESSFITGQVLTVDGGYTLG
jgi:3-oxoacyl-[acyl-carrier protein] reductase